MGKIIVNNVNKGIGKSGLTTIRRAKRIIIDVSDDGNQYAEITYDEVDLTPSGDVAMTSSSQTNKKYIQKDASEQLVQIAQLLFEKVEHTLTENPKLPLQCPDYIDITNDIEQ